MRYLTSEHQKIVDRVCKNLKITQQELLNRMKEYNDRVEVLNEKTIQYAKDFIAPKGMIIDDKFVYNLNDDDKIILSGYKKKVSDTLKEEFQDLYDNWDDVKIFEQALNSDIKL